MFDEKNITLKPEGQSNGGGYNTASFPGGRGHVNS